MPDRTWRETNRAHWDEAAALHVGPTGYDLAELRAGQSRLNAIEEGELGPVAGLRVLHLQCHFGRDTLILAQRGASVVGLDFSPAAIGFARTLAVELGVADRARFVEADLYDARAAIGEVGFDMVYVTWGALGWLPDIAGWAAIVAHFLRPGGTLYLAEAHPAALVLDDEAAGPDGAPGFFVPYFSGEALVMQERADYVDTAKTLANATTHTWLHPLGTIVTALIAAGLRLDWLHEHPAATWRMWQQMVEGADGLWRWPDTPWLPLSFSLKATRS